jgi:toxin ParE1/3/4
MRRKTLAHEVVFRPAAQRDLDALYKYIRDKGGGAVVAIGFVRRIREHCLGFANFPERGARRDDIRRGLRLVGFERKVTIAFSVESNSVRIARIYYRGRDPMRLLRNERDNKD